MRIAATLIIDRIPRVPTAGPHGWPKRLGFYQKDRICRHAWTAAGAAGADFEVFVVRHHSTTRSRSRIAPYIAAQNSTYATPNPQSGSFRWMAHVVYP